MLLGATGTAGRRVDAGTYRGSCSSLSCLTRKLDFGLHDWTAGAIESSRASCPCYWLACNQIPTWDEEYLGGNWQRSYGRVPMSCQRECYLCSDRTRLNFPHHRDSPPLNHLPDPGARARRVFITWLAISHELACAWPSGSQRERMG